MKLNDLEFLETLKRDNQVCGGDNNSDFDVDVDVMIDVEFDIDLDTDIFDVTGLDSADIVVCDGWIETGAVLPPPGSDPSAYYITVVGWDGGEFSGSLISAIN